MLRFDPSDADDRPVGVRLHCDHCWKPLGDQNAAVAVIADDGRVLLAHEGDCHGAIETRLLAQEAYQGWYALAALLAELDSNHRPAEGGSDAG